MDIGRIGVWQLYGRAPLPVVRQAIAEIERLGYGALWVGEMPVGRECLSGAAVLLAHTERVVVATGIANLWARDAVAMAAAGATLAEAYPNRFLLGVGVSHAHAVAMRGHEYARPLAATSAYLDQMAEARKHLEIRPEPPAPLVIAALRPRMLELARDKTDGAHPYFVPPEHTERARQILGPGKILAPEQAVVLETDPAKARAVAREHTSFYLNAPNYVNNLRTFGFDDPDFADGGSDRLVDAIVAWGDVDAVAARVRLHLDAGADHVALQPLPMDLAAGVKVLAELAPALL